MNLDLVPDDDLVDELMKRYDTIVIGARRIKVNGGATDRYVWWHGDMDACVGLCHGVAKQCTDNAWTNNK